MEANTAILFTPHQMYVQRVLSVVASSTSIAAGLIAFYMYVSMRVKVFRHHLILLLLLFDFGKAVVLLWYPARVLDVPSAYDNVNFCDVVGFFTSAFIEGADFAVLSLAIHTAILVFTKNSGPEGGLYRYRYAVYTAHFFLPLTMAALGFINNGRKSYIPLVTWCYLPIYPRWSRFVLSWAPRYIIIVSIFTIYIAIYIYVKLEYRKVLKEFKQSQTYLTNDSAFQQQQLNEINTGIGDADLSAHDYTSYILDSSDLEMAPNGKNIENISTDSDSNSDPHSKLKHKHHSHSTVSFKTKAKIKSKKIFYAVCRSLLVFISYFPGFGFLTPAKYFPKPVDDEELDPTTIAIRDFQRESLANFQMKRNAIERQIRSIFVYPVAYVFLWMAPFAVHILQYNYEIEHGGVFWISAIAAFMQPFNCVVDTVAFSIREKPWIDRKEVIFTRENWERIKYKLSFVFPCCFRVEEEEEEEKVYDDKNSKADNGNNNGYNQKHHSYMNAGNNSNSNTGGNNRPNIASSKSYTDKGMYYEPDVMEMIDLSNNTFLSSTKLKNNSINSNNNLSNNNNYTHINSISQYKARQTSTGSESSDATYPPRVGGAAIICGADTAPNSSVLQHPPPPVPTSNMGAGGGLVSSNATAVESVYQTPSARNSTNINSNFNNSNIHLTRSGTSRVRQNHGKSKYFPFPVTVHRATVLKPPKRPGTSRVSIESSGSRRQQDLSEDENVFRSTTAQPVTLNRHRNKNNNQVKRSTSRKRGNRGSGIVMSDDGNSEDESDDGKEIDILEFLR